MPSFSAKTTWPVRSAANHIAYPYIWFQSSCPWWSTWGVRSTWGAKNAAVGRPDGRVGVDVLLPAHNGPGLVVDQVGALGDVVIGQVHAEEAGAEHPGGCEDVLAHVVPVGQAARLFDEQAQQHIAAVAVATPLAGRKIWRLVGELREEVGGLGDRVVGPGLPDVCVIFAAHFVGVVGDT